MSHRRTFTGALLSLCLVVPALLRAADLPVEVPATDPSIRYIGRFDMKDAAGPRANWSASAVEVRFTGAALNIKLKASAGNGDHQEFQAVVDGRPTQVLKVNNNATAVLSVAEGLSEGNHIAQVVKRNEGYQGVMQVLGFQLSAGGKLLPPVVPDKRIEIVGDSISAGYGNEDNDRKHSQTIANTNAHMTYGSITARAFGADFTDLAWSGRKMWPDNTMPAIYDRTISTDDKGAKWDFSMWIPQVVLINLATNDFAKAAPDQAKWCGAYKEFIAVVRKNYPEAHIYLASGTMMYGQGIATLKKYLASIQTDLNDPKIHLIDFGTQNEKDGIGGDWHPTVKTHQKMADKFIAALETDLGWKRVEVP